MGEVRLADLKKRKDDAFARHKPREVTTPQDIEAAFEAWMLAADEYVLTLVMGGQDNDQASSESGRGGAEVPR